MLYKLVNIFVFVCKRIHCDFYLNKVKIYLSIANLLILVWFSIFCERITLQNILFLLCEWDSYGDGIHVLPKDLARLFQDTNDEYLVMCEKTGELCKGIAHLIRKFQLLSICLSQIALFAHATSWAGAEIERRANCNIIKAKEIIIADCASKGLHLDVPQDLEERLHVLNLSRNRVVNINDNSFQRYRDSLTTLDMSFLNEGSDERNPSIGIEFSSDSFSSLHKLEYLDLTNSCWSKSFVLPKKIRILKIENCSSVLNISYLYLLEEFYAAGNGWTYAPKFHRLAPMRSIDLRRNPLVTFDLEMIAPFCDLRVLRLDAFPTKSLKREKHSQVTYCTCKKITYWLTYTKVEHDHWNCIPPLEVGFAPKCDLSPSENVLRLRRDCLAKRSVKSLTSSANWWMVVVAAVIILSLLFAALIVNGVKNALRRGRARRSSSDDEEEEEHETD